jgi:hypothetical protein
MNIYNNHIILTQRVAEESMKNTNMAMTSYSLKPYSNLSDGCHVYMYTIPAGLCLHEHMNPTKVHLICKRGRERANGLGTFRGLGRVSLYRRGALGLGYGGDNPRV